MADIINATTVTRIDADVHARKIVQNLHTSSISYGSSTALGSTLAVGTSITISNATYFSGGRIAVSDASVAAPTALDARLDALEEQLGSSVFFAANFGVKADGRTVTDAAITTATRTLTSTTAQFSDADTGKLCVVVGAGTAVSGTLNGASGVAPITGLTVNALAATIPPGGINLDDGAGHTQKFVTSGALAGATTIPFSGPVVGGLTTALSTAGAITTLAVAPLNFVLPAGTVALISVSNVGVTKTQTFTTAGAAIGATSIPITSATPNFAYPESTTVFGSPIAQTPTFNFPNGTTVKVDVPALSTTISSVSTAGVATLASSAGATVSSAECFFATDDTAALNNCRTATEAVFGTMVLPEGDVGISAAIVSNVALTIVGQGVKEFYGGTGSANDANWPTIAPYLKGSVIVQCSPNADVLTLTKQGVTQHVKNVGLRFAGRFLNTGHGLNSANPAGGLGQIDSVWQDVKVFGHDGNHYGFLADSPELMRWSGLRSYGGGGMWFKTNSAIPGPPGNITCDDYYGCTFVAGYAQGYFIDASGGPGAVAFDSCVWDNLEHAVRIPNPVLTNHTPPPDGGVQNCLVTFNALRMTIMGMVGAGFESDPTGATLTYPSGPASFRTNDVNSAFSKASADAPTTGPVSGTSYQNKMGKPLWVMQEFLLQPKTAASASTTTSAILASGATSITVVSSTGFLVGDGIQIGSAASNDLEFAIIATVPDATHITVTIPGAFGLEVGHASGVTVSNGASVLYAEISPTTVFPSKRVYRCGAAITALHQHVGFSLPLPSSYYYRLTWANAGRMWTDFIGSFG